MGLWFSEEWAANNSTPPMLEKLMERLSNIPTEFVDGGFVWQLFDFKEASTIDPRKKFLDFYYVEPTGFHPGYGRIRIYYKEGKPPPDNQAPSDSNIWMQSFNFTAEDAVYFSIFEQVIRLLGIRFLGGGSGTTAQLEDVDGTGWQATLTLHGLWESANGGPVVIQFSSQNAGQSSGPLTLDDVAALASQAASYVALFQDSGNEVFKVPFSVSTDGDACAVADAIAGHSDAQWYGLSKVRDVRVDSQDFEGNPINQHFRQPAQAGSDVQAKARTTYRGAGTMQLVRLEIPSPLPSLVSKGSRTTKTDPLGPEVRPLVTTEHGAPAATLLSCRYGIRKRGG